MPVYQAAYVFKQLWKNRTTISIFIFASFTLEILYLHFQIYRMQGQNNVPPGWVLPPTLRSWSSRTTANMETLAQLRTGVSPLWGSEIRESDIRSTSSFRNEAAADGSFQRWSYTSSDRDSGLPNLFVGGIHVTGKWLQHLPTQQNSSHSRFIGHRPGVSETKSGAGFSVSSVNGSLVLISSTSYQQTPRQLAPGDQRLKESLIESELIYRTRRRAKFPRIKPWKARIEQIANMLKVENANCAALFKGSKKDQVSGAKAAKRNLPLTDNYYLNLTRNCRDFRRVRGYIMSPLTQQEHNFPLAYSMLVYKDVEMVERLLRAIYRPQNYYCIHVDAKASKTFTQAVSSVVKCLPNVFTTSYRVAVHWGQFSVLEPELLCMRELWRFPRWKYFINLTGQEFPLRTNWELVNIFQAYRGASDVMTHFKCAENFKSRWKKTQPPQGLRPAKGSVHITVSRPFVDFILHNQTSQDLLNWTRHTELPDETFFPTLNANPHLGIKGTYKGDKDSCDSRPSMMRYKSWKPDPCAGRRVRNICILTTGDLPRLAEAPQLFANKFFLHEDRTVIECLEEKLINATRDEYLGAARLNTSFYSNLEFVLNQIT